MKKIFVVPHLITFVLLLASQAFGLTVSLHRQALVSSPAVLLGDISAISPVGSHADILAGYRVAISPEPGKSRMLQANAIIRSLGRNAASTKIKWQGAKTITVTRKAQIITKKQMKGIIAQYIARHLKKLPDADIRLTSIRTPENLVLPTGKLTYTVRPSKPAIIGSTSFNILFMVNGKTVKNCTVHGKLEIIAPVATAAVNLRRGMILTAEQIEMVRRDISRLNAPYFSIAQATGLQVKRTIRAGRPFDTMNVAPPPVIRKGEPVIIVAQRGALNISTKGIAVMDGRPGEFIRVQNISSNKLIYCKVAAPGIVSVEF